MRNPLTSEGFSGNLGGREYSSARMHLVRFSKGVVEMRGLRLVAVAVALLWTSGGVEGKQYTRRVQGREVVVHTNPIPVVLHRMVPPQHGRHVTEREISSGKVPQPGRLLGGR